jgi:hypothetical protein
VSQEFILLIHFGEISISGVFIDDKNEEKLLAGGNS